MHWLAAGCIPVRSMLSTQAPAVAAADEEGAAGGAGGVEAAANQHAAPMGEAIWQVRCCRCVLGCEPDLLRSGMLCARSLETQLDTPRRQRWVQQVRRAVQEARRRGGAASVVLCLPATS